MNSNVTKNWRVRATGNPQRPYIFEMTEATKKATSLNRVASTWWTLHLAGYAPGVSRPTD